MSHSPITLGSQGASHVSTIGTIGTYEPYLDQLAHLIADHGIGAFESDIARFVVRLRAGGHCGPLLTVLADKVAAPVVRERAFGQLLSLATEPTRPERTASSHEPPEDANADRREPVGCVAA